MLLMKGNAVAAHAKQEIASKIENIRQKNINVTLAILIVGDDPASHAYKNRMVKLAETLGILTKTVLLPADSSLETVLQEIDSLNKDNTITGILPMMPMPKHLDGAIIADSIAVSKDVDCLNTKNIGELYAQNMKWAPCTPRAAIATLEYYNIPIAGKHAVVLGRSNVVGKPLANLLLAKNATVTICHSKTANLAEMTRQADILVAAIGVPHFVTPDMVKEGAVIIDVGINQVGDELVGDVHPDVQAKSSAFTPVPGGIGTVTTTMVVQALTKGF